MPSRVVRAYLEAIEQANLADAEGNEPSASPPKNVSSTDPAARWTAAPGDPAFFAYSTSYLIDLEAGVIVDVEATPAHQTQEVESTKTMIDRTEAHFGLKRQRLVGDTVYGTAPMLGWMVKDKSIIPHVPVSDRSERGDGTLSSSEFAWNELANEYRCHQGQALLSDRLRSDLPFVRFGRPNLRLADAARQTSKTAGAWASELGASKAGIRVHDGWQRAAPPLASPPCRQPSPFRRKSPPSSRAASR